MPRGEVFEDAFSLQTRLRYAVRETRNQFNWRSFLRCWWILYLFVSLTIGLATAPRLNDFFVIVGQIRVSIVAQNIAVLFFMVVVGMALMKVHPVLKWSWWRLFRKSGPRGNAESDDEIEGNIIAIPLRVKYVGFMFCCLLILSLPHFAIYEEQLFRAGTQDWIGGIARSVGFGFAHCLVGVPIAFGAALVIPGLWFTHQYFAGGVDMSALHHTAYNLSILGPTLLFMCLPSKKEAKQ